MNCNSLTQSFNNSPQTVIIVDDALRSRICDVPTVTTYHRNPDGTYSIALVSVSLTGMPLTQILVDHGGLASGFIKVQ